ncbi:MAG TPA: DUF4390 domain-containing protein [bacterium]
MVPVSDDTKGRFRLGSGTPLFHGWFLRRISRNGQNGQNGLIGLIGLSGLIAAFCLLPFSGWPKGQNWRFNEIHVKDGRLRIHFYIGTLFNRDVFSSLHKGMTAAVEYQVQLWKEQVHWADQLVAEEFCRMKIAYDGWEKRYAITFRDGSVVLVNEDGVWEHCAKLNGYPILDAEKLEPNRRYRIVIKVTFQPMSIENVQDIKRWLSGEAEGLPSSEPSTSKAPLKKAGDWMLGLVVNLSGFGDKVVIAKSPPFLWQDGSVSVEKEK